MSATLDAHLRAAGVMPCTQAAEAVPGDALVVYSPPDVVLAAGLEALREPPSPQQLAAEYKRVQSFSGRQPLIAGWRLQALPPEVISAWLADAAPIHADHSCPTPEPFTALLAKTLLEAHPDVLEAYLDLELTAELAGGAPDTDYLQRLIRASADTHNLLEKCWLPHKQLQANLQEKAAQIARSEALSVELQQARQETALHGEELLQLQGERQQLQGEVEKLTAADQEKAAQIGQLRQALEAESARVVALQAESQQQLDAQAGVLRLSREAEAQHLARAQALEVELQEARQGVERQVLELQQLRGDLEKLTAADQEKATQIGQQRQALEAEGARVVDLEANLARLTSERNAVAREREAALTTVADLQEQLDRETEALRLARATEAQLVAKAEGLDQDNQQVHAEAKRLQTQLQQAREETKRLFLADHSNAARIEQLQNTIATQAARITSLATDLGQIRNERDGAFRERDGRARERDGLARELEKVLAKVADLQDQLSKETEALRLTRDAETQLQARVEVLNLDMAQAQDAAQRLLSQLHQAQEELERLFLADQNHVARIASLEAELEQIRKAHDGSLRERDGLAQERTAALATVANLQEQLSRDREALRLARDTETQLQIRADRLNQEREEVQAGSQRILEQLHHLQEQLETSFLHGQAGDQLIAAQHEQLMRAQSLMSRLLVQATRSLVPGQTIAVEVLPPRNANPLPGSSDRSGGQAGAGRLGRSGGLLRKVWSR